jgi:fibronectin type 3 domain-containing protein
VGEIAAPSAPAGTRSAKQNATRSYTDSLAAQIPNDNPSAFATYAVEVLNGQGRSAGLSNQARVSLVGTLPPPQDFAANVTGQGVMLTWTGDAPSASTHPMHYVYRVYRSVEGSTQQALVGDIAATSEHRFSLTDSNIEWEKTYDYRAETVTVVALANKPEIQVEGDDAPEIKVFVHDVFPPAVPSGLQAVSSGPGQKTFVDLVWAPVADVDLDGYNVYRHEAGMAAEKVNAEPVKTPAYRDESVLSGKRYFYSVSAVDVRGNESGRSEEANEVVP